jgi:hypothetical protein
MSELDSPPSLEDLDDYLFGAMSDEDAASFEEALFHRAASGDHALADFVEGIGVLGRVVLGRTGSVVPPTAESVEILRQRGFKVEVADAVPGTPYQARWTDEADLVVTHFITDMRGHTGRFDVDIETPDGNLIKTMFDVSYDPNDGTFYAVCEASLARTTRGVHVFWKLYETVDGKRRHIDTIEQVPTKD